MHTKIRFQDPQSELFGVQPSMIDWQTLPRETQQKTKRLLTELLRAYAGSRLPGVGAKDGEHE